MDDRGRPYPVDAGGLKFRSLSAGHGAVVSLLADDDTAAANTARKAGTGPPSGGYYWGELYSDTEARPTSSLPAALPGDVLFAMFDAGHDFGCGIDAAGTAYCLGRNWSGRLGTGDPSATLNTTTPLPVAGGHTYSTLATSQWGEFTCGVVSSSNISIDGAIECWGALGVGRAPGRAA